MSAKHLTRFTTAVLDYLSSPFPKTHGAIPNDRYVRDKTEHITGGVLESSNGVLQGGSLSPTLFMIYMADMPDLLQGTNHIMYVDDVSQIISCEGKSTQFMAQHEAIYIEEIHNYENNKNKYLQATFTKSR